MMRYLFCIFVVALHTLYAVALKQILTYPEQDKLDVLLLLDAPFGGEVGTASIQNEKVTMISEVITNNKWSKAFQTSPIKKLEIIPKNNNLYLNVDSRTRYYVKPSISKDKSTLRLSFFNAESGMVSALLQTPTTIKPAPLDEVFNTSNATKIANTDSSSGFTKQPAQSIGDTKDSAEGFGANLRESLKSYDVDIDRYWYYILGFAGVFVVLLFLRARVRKMAQLNESLKVVSQSQIDPKNKVIIIETKDYFYMVLLGEKSNLLLDKIPRHKQKASQEQPQRLAQNMGTKTKPISSSSTIGNDHAFNEDFWKSLKNIKQ